MSRQKAKGTRWENDVTEKMRAAGLHAERVGIIIGYPGDVEVTLNAPIHTISSFTDCWGQPLEKVRIECKRRARAWKDLSDWLDKNDTDILVCRADRRKGFAVMDLERFTAVLQELNFLRGRR